MNKTYRSVWSDVQGAWVAVSELTSARGKGSRSVRLMLAAGLLAIAGAAHGQATVNLTNVSLSSSTDQLGYPKGSLKTGTLVYNTNTVGTTIVPGTYIWDGTEWVNTAAATVATNTQAEYFHANSTDQGNSTTQFSGATGTESVAAGPNAVASNTDSVAIGNGAQSTNAEGVALGANSVDAAPVQVSNTTINGATTATFAGTATGVVSVGALGKERQIINVAPGAISATSTDAVNGSELFATNQAIAASTVHYYSVNDGGTQGTNYANNGATGTDSLAAGVNASATNTDSVAIGNGAQSTNAEGVALGANSVDAAPVQVSNTTINGATTATFAGTATGVVSVGALGKERQIINVAPGAISATSTDAVNGSELFATNQAIAASTVHYYSVNDGGTQGTNYANNGATGTDSLAAGVNASATNTDSVAIGNGAQSTNAEGVALGANSVDAAPVQVSNTTIAGATTATFAGTATGVVSVGALGKERQIINVAPGAISATSTDAVNGSELYATNQAIGNVATIANEGWNLSTNGGAATNVAPGGTVDLSPGKSGNITVSQSGTNVTIDTNPNLNATSLTTTDGNGNTTVTSGTGTVITGATGSTSVSSNGITITPPPGGTPVSLTSSGLNNGGNVITNVAQGTIGTDAVNVDQLNSTVAKSATHYYSVNDGGTQGGNYDNNGASGLDALAAGVNAQASGANSLALGSGAQATGAQSIAVGDGNVVSGASSGAFGDPNIITGTGSYAVGNNNTINANNSFVLGNNVTVTNANNVVLGNGSADVAAVQVSSAVINGVTYSLAGVASGVVSVGALGAERQIANVAPGVVSATSTYAVNGSQLFATDQAIENLSLAVTKGQTHYYSVNDGGTQGSNYANDGATGVDALAAGVNASASGASSVAIGSGASVSTLGGIALGAGSIASRAAGTYVDPISGTSFTTTQGAVSVGSTGSTRQITNVADGTALTDAVNLGQLETAFANATKITNVGPTQPTTQWIVGNPVTYVAPNAAGQGSTAAGSGSTASGANSTAVGDSATASGANSVALGANSVANAANTVSVGAPGSERRITNVSPGINGTDAVNVNQLNAGLSQIDSLRRDMYAGTAAAMAVAGLPQPSGPGKSMVSVASSTWHGQEGFSVGVSTVSENNRWIVKGALTTSTRGGAGGVIGAGYQW